MKLKRINLEIYYKFYQCSDKAIDSAIWYKTFWSIPVIWNNTIISPIEHEIERCLTKKLGEKYINEI